jgi:PGF-CTERM protein
MSSYHIHNRVVILFIIVTAPVVLGSTAISATTTSNSLELPDDDREILPPSEAGIDPKVTSNNATNTHTKDNKSGHNSTDTQTEITVNPGKQTISTNETLTLEIQINTQTNITAIEFVLTYNADIFDVVTVGDGDFLTQDGAETISIETIVNETNGTVTGAEARKSEDGVSDDGVLQTIEVRSTNNSETESVTTVGINDVYLLNETSNEVDLASVIVNPAVIEIVDSGGGNGGDDGGSGDGSDTAPPMVSVDAPETISINQTFTVDASNSTDNGTGIANYTFRLQNGTVVTQPQPTLEVNFPEPGTQNITIEVTDKAGNQNSSSVSIEVVDSTDGSDGDDSGGTGGDSGDETESDAPGFGPVITLVGLFSAVLLIIILTDTNT